MSTAVTPVRAHPDKYEKDFNIVVAFLTQHIDKKAPMPSLLRGACDGTFRGKIELKKYF